MNGTPLDQWLLDWTDWNTDYLKASSEGAAAMKLYIWEDVLRDYTSGMIVALAPDLESALATAQDDYTRSEMGRVTPTVVEVGDSTEPQLWSVHGGG